MMDSEELAAIALLKAMSREQLDLVDYQVYKWLCQGKGCKNGTKVRDYGIHPVYYLPRKKSEWIDLTKTFWMCGRHGAYYKHLMKRFDKDHVFRTLFDFTPPTEKLLKLDYGRIITVEQHTRKL